LSSALGGKSYTLSGGGTLVPSSTSTGSTVPSIAAVVNAASGVAGVAPNTWCSIFGSNLGASVDATKVTVNGKAATLSYVSSTQTNLLTPDDSTVGSVTVSVTTSAGTGSAAVTMQAVMPGIFATISRGSGTFEVYATGLNATAPSVTIG